MALSRHPGVSEAEWGDDGEDNVTSVLSLLSSLMSAKASYLQTVSGDSGDSGGLVTFYLLLSALNTANIRPDLHHKSKYSAVAILLSLLRIMFPSDLSASSVWSVLVLEYKTNKTNKTKSSQ